MKIAIYEPNPHICGPSQWMWHVHHGLTALGHEAHVVTSTKSGKERVSWGAQRPGCHWTTRRPHVFVKDRDIVELLDSYDLIILTEPRSIRLDKEAEKKNETPNYVRALHATKTRWTTALHGPQYSEKLAPFTTELLEGAPTFTGVMATPNLAYADTRPELTPRQWDYVVLPLPFQPTARWDTVPSVKAQRVGMTGRVINNKGQHYLALGAELLADGWEAELHGAASIGASANYTYDIWAELLRRGWEGEREGENSGDKIRPHKWWLKKGTHSVSYHGGYFVGTDVCKRLAVHLNLTSVNYSTGLLEFVSLEALDAGSLIVIPRHLHTLDYPAVILPTFEATVGMKKADPTEAITAVNDAIHICVNDPAERRARIMRGREMLLEHHDPKRWCRALLNEVATV